MPVRTIAWLQTTDREGLGKIIAQFQLSIAKTKLNEISQLQTQTEDLITNFSTNNSKDFDELDKLKDGNGTTVDVYIRVEKNLNSNRFDNTIGGMENMKDLDGLTEVNYASKNQLIKNDKTGAYLPVKSILFGKNTAVIIVDANVINKLRVVSHEAGHTIYNVTKMLEYVNWLNNHPKSPPGGHGKDNPSGIEAKKREAPFVNIK